MCQIPLSTFLIATLISFFNNKPLACYVLKKKHTT